MFSNSKTTWNLGTVFLASIILVAVGTSTGRADFIFGEPTNMGPPINSSNDEYGPCISSNGLELYFTRGSDLWVTRRPTMGEEWGPPVNLGATVNGGDDWAPCISADSLSLYFNSDRAGGSGGDDLWVTTRTAENDNWVTPVNLGPSVNGAAIEWQPCISSDGLELYFTSNRPGGYGDLDLWVTTRAGVQDDWGTPVNLGPKINTPAQECWASISPDGLVLFFASTKPGGFSTLDMYMARRVAREDPWGTPVNLGSGINDVTWQSGSKVSSDGSMLYFMCGRPGLGGLDVWQAPILPVVDFNGDGKVDAADMTLMEANWGKNTSLCDIGPFAWGDGVVDELDLKVLMESLMTPGPKASDIPCNIVLSWIAPSFAESCDVYFGASFEAVSGADRDNPQDVLVSQGQTQTVYTPPEVLEFSQTYYWRIDTVLGPSNGDICKGPVLSFTTEPYIRVIQSIIANASSAQTGMGPQNTVNGSGLDKNDRHSTTGTDMWQSANVAGPHWIQYEFDQVYTLQELWVWNSNQLIEPFLGFGARTVKIEHSDDGTAWTSLVGVPEFAKAPGTPGYMADTKISFGGVPAQYVRLTIEKGWGVTQAVGLSEVRFFYIPDRSATNP